MQEYIAKAKILTEALPYIKEFNKKIVVIKYGGSALTDGDIKNTVISDIALMKFVGILPVIVHGGGPEISKTLGDMGIKSEFVDGLRVTDKQTMGVVEMVLAGKLSKDIVADLNMQGVKAVGICGKDAGMLKAEKLTPGGRDIGFVGSIKNVDIKIINTLLDNDFIPVIAPIACDDGGNGYNVNADYAAIAIASALNAEKLVFLTDVSGILSRIDDPASLISSISSGQLQEMIDTGTITGGMIPKASCAIEAAAAGIKNVHIIDGRVEHCLLLETFTKYGIGTMVRG